VETKAKILDLGCGDGTLLKMLTEFKHIEGSGIEMEPERVKEAIANGVNVIQGDLEEIIKNYPDNSFDYCILSQTLQDLSNPATVIEHMTRVSRQTLIAFYNLAQFSSRMQIFFKGTFPKSPDLPYSFLTTNISFLSVKDFKKFCQQKGISISEEIFLTGNKEIHLWPNLRARLCVFELQKQ
jgi:methionine biosynthesis protein MetW